MKITITLLILFISLVGYGQAKPDKKEVLKDSSLTLPQWHVARFAYLDKEIKRLQGTTIEDELARLQSIKDEVLTSYMVSKVDDLSRIDVSTLVINGNKITFKLKVLPPK